METSPVAEVPYEGYARLARGDEAGSALCLIARLIGDLFGHARAKEALLERYVRGGARRGPYLVGVSGSVSVGKSRFCEDLGRELAALPQPLRCDVASTDGFLHPNARLVEMGLLARKGFPETYDQDALLSFMKAARSASGNLRIPLYSHAAYGPSGDRSIDAGAIDILFVEGLNVLQAARCGRLVGEVLDFSIFIDADPGDIESWYLDRLLRLRAGARGDPSSYFYKYVEMEESAVIEQARQVWRMVNYENLRQHILPTRDRADLIVRKVGYHTIDDLFLRHG